MSATKSVGNWLTPGILAEVGAIHRRNAAAALGMQETIIDPQLVRNVAVDADIDPLRGPGVGDPQSDPQFAVRGVRLGVLVLYGLWFAQSLDVFAGARVAGTSWMRPPGRCPEHAVLALSNFASC